MAIVKTYHFPGCTVHIDDSAYAGVPEEELARRAENARRVAWGIILAAEERERKPGGREKGDRRPERAV